MLITAVKIFKVLFRTYNYFKINRCKSYIVYSKSWTQAPVFQGFVKNPSHIFTVMIAQWTLISKIFMFMGNLTLEITAVFIFMHKILGLRPSSRSLSLSIFLLLFALFS